MMVNPNNKNDVAENGFRCSSFQRQKVCDALRERFIFINMIAESWAISLSLELLWHRTFTVGISNNILKENHMHNLS